MTAIAFILSWLATIVLWATFLVAGLFLLRMILTWARVNPFARLPYHLTRWTERIVQPIRYQLGGRFMRYDFVPLLAAVIVLFAGLFLYNTLGELSLISNGIARRLQLNNLSLRYLIGQLILLAGIFYSVLIFLRILLPYFGIGYTNSFMRLAYKLTEPLLRPLRKYLTIGMVDFSAVIALILVQFVARLIAGIVIGVG